MNLLQITRNPKNILILNEDDINTNLPSKIFKEITGNYRISFRKKELPPKPRFIELIKEGKLVKYYVLNYKQIEKYFIFSVK